MPTCIKQQQAFLGIASDLCKFLPNCASTAAPLTYSGIKKRRSIPIGTMAGPNLSTLKNQLTTGRLWAILRKVGRQKCTNASQVGVGAVLIQRDPDEREHVVAYASRKLQDAEPHYHSNELKCLAGVWSADEIRHHAGAQNQFADTLSRNPTEEGSPRN